MKLKRPKRLGWIMTGVVVITLIVVSLLPKPMMVDVDTVSSGLLRQTIDAEGRTHLRSTYIVTLPASGTVTRISLRPGDSVRAGQAIAYYTPPVIDERQRASAIARADAARALESEAESRLAALKPLIEQARRRSERMDRLVREGAIPKEEAEVARETLTQLQKEFDAAQARSLVASHEASAARIAASAAPGQSVAITSPINGVVLRRFEDQERTLMAGTPLVEIGDRSAMEVIIDVLSTDAVSVMPGMKVLIEGWGGSDVLQATVRSIEPAARVKVSSLGVEEKRVDVIADLVDAPARLGDGYKVDARIVIWEGANVVRVPLSALFRDNGQWFVYKVEGDKVRRQEVKIDHRSGLTAEVVSGLQNGDVIVVHPSEDLSDGQSVEVRS
jgi:HlyD family secretion protein